MSSHTATNKLLLQEQHETGFFFSVIEAFLPHYAMAG
jgi:hypothetical protein